MLSTKAKMTSDLRYQSSSSGPMEHLRLPEDGQLCPAVIALSVVKYESPKLGTTGPDRELFTLETESFTINELPCFGSLNSMFRRAN